jgi:hypothetical protein
MSLNSGPEIGLCRGTSPPLPCKTVPAFSRHYSCENHTAPATPPTDSLRSSSPHLRTAATLAFPSSQPSPVPGFTTAIFCFDAFGR